MQNIEQPHSLERSIPQKEKAADIVFRIDTRRNQKEIVLKNILMQFEIGPFRFSIKLFGNFDFVKRTGSIACELHMKKPVEQDTTFKIVGTKLSLNHEFSMLELLQSFGLPSKNQLRKYLEFRIHFELIYDIFEKAWNIFGALRSDQYKLTICNKQFGIKEIGYKIGGRSKGKIEESIVYFKFDIAGTDLILKHPFGQKYLFQAQLQTFPLGKIITHFTNKVQFLAIFSALQNIQLKDIKFQFQNFSNLALSCECPIGMCRIDVQNGKFKAFFTPPQTFSFKDVCQDIQFLDALGLNKLKMQLRSQGEFQIDGVFDISTIRPVAALADMLIRGQSQSLKLEFSAAIRSWKQVTAKMNFLSNRQISEAVTLQRLCLEMKLSTAGPQFGVSGEISAKICEKDFNFKVSFAVGIVVKFTAQMKGTWGKPFGLRNSYLKDLVLEITSNGFGGAGQIKLGEMTAQAALSADYLFPTRNMIYFSLRCFQLDKVLSVFDVNIPQGIAKILSQIQINELTVQMVPPGGVTIGDRTYGQGFTAKLDCKIFGFKADFVLQYKNRSLKIYGKIDKINLGKFLILKSSKQPQKGPSFDLQVGLFLSSHLKIDGHIVIFDSLEREVYGQVNLQGIQFRTRGALKIFGWNFMEDSFLFRVGFLKINQDFLVQASFKMDHSIFQAIEKSLIEAANNMKKRFQQAQAKLSQAQRKLHEAQQTLDLQLQRQKNKWNSQKAEFDKACDKAKDDANTNFNAAKRATYQILQQEKQRALREMQAAKHTADRTLEQQLRRALKQLNDKKASAQKQLNDKIQSVQQSFREAQSKVDSIQRLINQIQNRPWYQRILLAQTVINLYASLGIAKGALIVAQEATKAPLVLARQACNAALTTAGVYYTGIIKTAQFTCDVAISSAQNIYEGAINKAQQICEKSISTAQSIFSAAIDMAKAAGDEAGKAYITLIDGAFNIAKSAVSLAEAGLIFAKQAVAIAEAGAKCALNFLQSVVRGISQILFIRKLFFQFDIKKEQITIEIDLTILGHVLKGQIHITFKQIADFVVMLANKIWEFLRGLF